MRLIGQASTVPARRGFAGPRAALVVGLAAVAVGCFQTPNKEVYVPAGGPGQSDGGSGDDGGLPDARVGPLAGPFELRVVVGGSGKGTVTSASGSIRCPGTCTAMIPLGQEVTLTAETAAPTVFGGWEGDCAGTAACTLTMTAGKVVGASFHAPGGVLWARPVPESTALVAAPDSIFVGGNAFGTFAVGDQTLSSGVTAVPWLAEFSGAGEVRWVKKYLPEALAFGAMSRMDSGDLVTAGFSGGAQPGGGRAAVLGKIDFRGNPIGGAIYKASVDTAWTFGRRYLLLTANNNMLEMFDDRGAAIPNTQIARPFTVSDATITADGALVVGGYFQGNLRLGNINWMSSDAYGDWVMARFNPDRSVAWVSTSPADQGARLELVTTDPDGNIVVTGGFTRSLQLEMQLFDNSRQGGGAIFVAKFDAKTGKPRWGRYVNSPMGLKSTALAADRDAVYLAVQSGGEVTVEGVQLKGAAVVVKYETTAGAHGWSTTLDGVVHNINTTPGGVYVLGAKLWKLLP
jgi:hypothetical protein